MSDASCEPLPYLTADLPGMGGQLKQDPADFVVEELPAYEPCGEGEHLFLWIEKCDVSAEWLTKHLALVLGISRHDVGMAGLKDRRAVTRQWVSVPAAAVADPERINTDQIRVLRAVRHRNKLRPGHLRGNRFELRVRSPHPDAGERAAAILTVLQTRGVPNFYGEQRFGLEGETLELGLALLRGEKEPHSVDRARRKFLVKLALSAVQSHLFNLVLSERMRDDLLHRVLWGDVMKVIASGGPFVVDDAEREQARFEAREIVTTGPLFGPKMREPQGEPAAREARVLAHSGLAGDHFRRFPKLTQGDRRSLLVYPEGLEQQRPGDGDPSDLLIRMTLPKGAYATVVMRELLRN